MSEGTSSERGEIEMTDQEKNGKIVDIMRMELGLPEGANVNEVLAAKLSHIKMKESQDRAARKELKDHEEYKKKWPGTAG